MPQVPCSARSPLQSSRTPGKQGLHQHPTQKGNLKLTAAKGEVWIRTQASWLSKPMSLYH